MNDENLEEGFERGKYKTPVLPGEYSYAEIENKIFAALDAKFRTLSRIKDYAGIERSFDLTPVIEGMKFDRKIRSVENGTITAFFRYREMPVKFHLVGDGTVEATFDIDFQPRDEQKIAEDAPSWRTYRTTATEKVKNANSRGGKKMNYNYKHIDTEALEKFAAELSNQVEIAKALGLSHSAFTLKLKKETSVREAYDRGHARYAAEGTKIKKYDVKRIEQYAFEGLSIADAAKKLGVPMGTLHYQVSDKSVNTSAHDAWLRGKSSREAESGGRRRITEMIIDLELLEQYSFENLSILDAAVRLGVNPGTLENYIYLEGELRDAWLRGRSRIAGGDMWHEPIDDAPDLVRDAEEVEETEEDAPTTARTEFYRKAFEKVELQNATEIAETSRFRSPEQVKDDKELCVSCGFAKYFHAAGDEMKYDCKKFIGADEVRAVEADPRFANQLDYLSKNGRSREGVEAKKIEFLETLAADEAEPEFIPAPELNAGIIIHDARTQGHKKHVALSNGGHIVLGFDGGFFEASKKERELLNRLADLVQEFEE